MTNINPSIFKTYDIRGVYPQEINEEAAFLIGRAFVKFFNKPNLNIIVGRDNRNSSSQLFKSLTKGIISEGANVIDIGLSTTPMMYWAVAYYKFDGGIEITASHNPAQDNGFKIVGEGATPISKDSGLDKIKDLISAFNFSDSNLQNKEAEDITKKEIIKDYIEFNLKFADLTKINPLEIVIDTANAVPGLFIEDVMSCLPCKTDYLFKELDGSFPNHNPDPLVKENLKTLQKEIKEKKADLGVSFDGDGDRMILIDEKGDYISGDLITALMAEIVLRKNPGAKILYDLRSSRIVEETIKKNKGIPIIYKVGHSLIKEKMRQENIIFAGELSTHFYHKEHYFCEAPFFVLFKILEEISQTGKSISELIKPFKKYYHSGEINFEIKNKDKEKIIKKLAEHYKDGEVSYLDGLRVDFEDWWFNIRPSHTVNSLRLNLETKKNKDLEKKIKEVGKLIKT